MVVPLLEDPVILDDAAIMGEAHAQYQEPKSVENSPTPYRSLRALRARSAPGSARESVHEKRGVPESV